MNPFVEKPGSSGADGDTEARQDKGPEQQVEQGGEPQAMPQMRSHTWRVRLDGPRRTDPRWWMAVIPYGASLRTGRRLHVRSQCGCVTRLVGGRYRPSPPPRASLVYSVPRETSAISARGPSRCGNSGGRVRQCRHRSRRSPKWATSRGAAARCPRGGHP